MFQFFNHAQDLHFIWHPFCVILMAQVIRRLHFRLYGNGGIHLWSGIPQLYAQGFGSDFSQRLPVFSLISVHLWFLRFHSSHSAHVHRNFYGYHVVCGRNCVNRLSFCYQRNNQQRKFFRPNLQPRQNILKF